MLYNVINEIMRRRRYYIGVTNTSTDATQALGDILIFYSSSSSLLYGDYDDDDDDDNSSFAMCYFSYVMFGHSSQTLLL